VAMFDLLALAAAAPSSSSPSAALDITQVLQFGLLGLIFLCLVFRKFIVPEWTLKQAEDRLERERPSWRKGSTRRASSWRSCSPSSKTR
jgi:hypothetical protein